MYIHVGTAWRLKGHNPGFKRLQVCPAPQCVVAADSNPSLFLGKRTSFWSLHNTGADPGLQVRGGAHKKMRRAEGGAKIFGVFRVKNHDFTPKNHFFFNFRGEGVRAGCAPLDPPLQWMSRDQTQVRL
jgi:hypothetical protein